jgi:hypothetical protein
MKIPRWAQVLIGVAIVGVFLAIGGIIAVTAYFSQNVVVNSSNAREADDEFDKIRQRFKGQLPLVELKEGMAVRSNPRTNAGGGQLSTLHILAWDSDEEKLAAVNVPWWVIRLKSGPIRFSTYTTGLDDDGVRLTPDEIERGGPGIILEATGRRGERVLLWAE